MSCASVHQKSEFQNFGYKKSNLQVQNHLFCRLMKSVILARIKSETLFIFASQNCFLMLQRKQSIFLLVSALCLVLTYFLPFAVFDNGAFQGTLRCYGFKDEFNSAYRPEISNYGLHIVLAVILVMTLFALISFNNRKRQLSILKITVVGFAGVFTLMALYINSAQVAVEKSIESAGANLMPTVFSPSIAMFLPVIAFICNYMAMRFIRKDEELVRSVDRIR